MAFSSSCPKCQKQVLVPEASAHDAVVQCPLCSSEYSLGEILASAPPLLIVVHPGSAAATAVAAAAGTAGLEFGSIAHASDPADGRVFSAHRVEPTSHDAEPLTFAGDEAHLAEGEQTDEAALFGGGFDAAEGDRPVEALAEDEIEPFGEHIAAPHPDNGHDLTAAPAEGDAPWGGGWGGFKEEGAREGDDEVGLAEPDQDEGLENVNFADITGKAAPGTGLAARPGDADLTIEPPKKKKRKREANMIVRLAGMAVAGLLAVVCVLGIASWRGIKFDFLPSWMQFNFNKTSTSTPKPAGQSNTPANVQAPVVTPNTPAPEAGKGSDTAFGETKPAPTPDNPAPSDSSKGTELAMNNPPNEASKPDAKPNNEPNLPGPDKPDVKPESKPDAKPAEPDPFGGPPAVAPVNEKAKPDAKPDVTPDAKPAVTPDAKPPDAKPDAKPDVPSLGAPEMPSKPDTPAKPDADPFGAAPPEVGPVNEKPKPDAKPDAKPEIKPDAKPDVPSLGSGTLVVESSTALPPDAKPDVPSKGTSEMPSKPETPAKPDADPFGGAEPPAVAPVNEKPKPDAKPDAKPDTKPDVKPEVPAPDKPDVPAKPDSPAIGPEPMPEVKPETKPEITPDAKPEVKPEVKPEITLDVKPAGLAPLQAPSFAVTDLDASLKTVSAAGAVDDKSYADWCKLAEVVTFVAGGADSQKQALRSAAEKAASNPQAASAIAASAKKLLDDKATKGGIVLAGTVTGVGVMNGISGTAIRMEGMDKPVRIFSAHPLGVKETDKVIIFGALVADPAKNLPGFPGKQPVVVWSDFATAMP